MNNNVKLDKKTYPETLLVHGLSHDGRGIATCDQKTVFINGALPGETVRYRIHQKHPTYDEATTLEIVTPASARTVPPCEHFGLCGGCSLQHMQIETQIALKQQTLLDQLKHFGKVTPQTILPPLSSQSVGYRRKARLGVKFVIKKDKLLIGFREKNSNKLADLSRCAVLHPAIGEKFQVLAELVRSLVIYQHIPQIEVAMGDETLALVFRHLEPLAQSDKEKLIAFGNTHNIHIYVQPNSPLPVTQLWPESAPQRLCYHLPDQQLELLFHPLDFTQINLEMNRLMVNQALTLLAITPEENALDLFSGIGNFSLSMARHALHVTGIEGSEEMTQRATDNARHNGMTNATFYAANLAQPPTSAPWMQVKYDKVLLDPPRVGAKEILPYLGQCKPKRIVYVSCNPATLARDAGELVTVYGYQLTAAGVMNMFPHTAHIEAIAVFENKNTDY